MKLYASAGSPFARKIRVMLIEKGAHVLVVGPVAPLAPRPSPRMAGVQEGRQFAVETLSHRVQL